MLQIKSPSYSVLALETLNPDDDETCLLYNEDEGEVVEEEDVEECICPVCSWENRKGCGNGSTGGQRTEDRGNGCDEFEGKTVMTDDRYRVGRGTRHCEGDLWRQEEKGMEGIEKRSEGRSLVKNEDNILVSSEDKHLLSSEDKHLVSSENRSPVKNEDMSNVGTEDKSIVSTEDRSTVRIYDRNLATTKEISLVRKKDRNLARTDHDYQEQTDDKSLERTEDKSLVSTEDIITFRTEDRSQVGTKDRSLERTESLSFFLCQLFVEEGWKECVQQTDTGQIKLSLTEQISARL